MPPTTTLSRSPRPTAVAAILAGVLIFAGHAGELVFGSPSDVVDVIYVLLLSGGIVALGVALWGLRNLAGVTRRGRVGVWLSLAGVAFLGLFVLLVLVELIQSGEVPENFAVFGLGFIMLFLGHLIFASDLRHSLGLAWVLPMVAAAGAAVALAVEADPYHDIGLFVFEAAWVALGLAMLRRKPTDRRGLQQARLASPDRR